jgi:hypothetical protein
VGEEAVPPGGRALGWVEGHIVLGAGVLGGGTPAFEGKASARLRLLGTKTYEGSNNVVLRYAVEKEGGDS